jgi:hypothetical protein
VLGRLSAGVLPFDSLTSLNHLYVVAGPGNYALGSVSDLRPRASCMGTPEAPSGSCWSAGPSTTDQPKTPMQPQHGQVWATGTQKRIPHGSGTRLNPIRRFFDLCCPVSPVLAHHSPTDVTQAARCRIHASCRSPWQATAPKNCSTVHKPVNV